MERITKRYSINTESSEEFFTKFLTSINSIRNISRPSDVKVLALLCTTAEYDGRVDLPSKERKKLLEKLNMTTQAFSNSLSRLKKLGVLCGSRSKLEINLHYFWEGTLTERNNVLKNNTFELTLTFYNPNV